MGLESVRPILRFVSSTIGAKILMALTGIGLALFLVVHMVGNLRVFLGQEALNDYAALLKSLALPLWAARLGLLATFAAHVGLAFWLSARNEEARPVGYAIERTATASWASRHMLLTGLLVLVFLGYHLAHFTLGLTNPADFERLDPLGRHDVYGMVVRGFSNPGITLTYVAAMALLALHLWHGLESLWRSLGASNPRLVAALRLAAAGGAVALALGFSAVPLAVLCGLVGGAR